MTNESARKAIQFLLAAHAERVGPFDPVSAAEAHKHSEAVGTPTPTATETTKPEAKTT